MINCKTRCWFHCVLHDVRSGPQTAALGAVELVEETLGPLRGVTVA